VTGLVLVPYWISTYNLEQKAEQEGPEPRLVGKQQLMKYINTFSQSLEPAIACEGLGRYHCHRDYRGITLALGVLPQPVGFIVALSIGS